MYKVLIVDDEPSILNGLKHIINWAEHGIEIIGLASNGQEALDIIKNNKVDILITDVKMPLLDGLGIIRQINENSYNIKSIILSGHDDFKYVKEAVKLGVENYLLKPINTDELSFTLLTTIKKIDSDLYKQISIIESMSVFRENILYRWVTNYISSQELEEKASVVGIPLSYSQYLISIIKIVNSKSFNLDNGKKENALLSFAINNICTEITSQVFPCTIFSALNGDVIILFHGDDIETKRPEIIKILNSIINVANKLLNTNMFASVGSLQSDYELVYKSYSDAINLLEYSLILPANTLVDYDEVQHSSITLQKKINIDFISFNKLLLAKEEDKCVRFLDKIYKQVREMTGITPYFIQNMTIEILFNILSTINIFNDSNENIYEFENLFSNISKIKNIEELVNLLKLVINQSITHLIVKDKKQNPIIKQVLNYIEENFNNEISIKLLSSIFNTNAAYLGQLFKSETGDMLTNYLNKIRVEKAKVMILNSRLKANKISEKVGYINPNYFYRIFKKITGISPTEFKNKL